MANCQRPVAPERTAHEKDKAAFVAHTARCRLLPLEQQLDIAASTGGKLINVIQYAIDQSKEEGSTVDINQALHGLTLLQQASSNGQLEIVEMLLLNGADPNLVARVSTIESADDEPGWAPLIEAVVLPDSAMVGILLEHGADPNVTSSDGNNLFWHLMNGADVSDSERMRVIMSITEQLLAAGFDPEASQPGTETAIEIVDRVAPDSLLAGTLQDGKISPEQRAATAQAICEASAEEEQQLHAAKAAVVERIASSEVMPQHGHWYAHHRLQSPVRDPEAWVADGDTCGGFLPEYK